MLQGKVLAYKHLPQAMQSLGCPGRVRGHWEEAEALLEA